MGMFSGRKAWSRGRTASGSTLTWFRANMRSGREHRSILGASASSGQRLMKRSWKGSLELPRRSII